ncbi:hypothetical protein Ndes2526B_g04787 [Nannochloris sp. 'desiccata']
MSAAVGSVHFRAIITPTVKHSVQQKSSTKHRQHIICDAKSSAAAPDFDRRATLFSLAAAAATTQLQLPAQAQDFTIFYGTASPPTSYGGYGGNAEEDAKYKFEYPTGWKTQAPKQGEDNKSFKVTDIDTTIAGFAGADYDLQDALSSATDTIRGTRELDGETYFDIQVDSPDVQYLCSVTVKMGKVFALFVKCPTKSFKQDEEAFRHVVETFRTI